MYKFKQNERFLNDFKHNFKIFIIIKNLLLKSVGSFPFRCCFFWYYFFSPYFIVWNSYTLQCPYIEYTLYIRNRNQSLKLITIRIILSKTWLKSKVAKCENVPNVLNHVLTFQASCNEKTICFDWFLKNLTLNFVVLNVRTWLLCYHRHTQNKDFLLLLF